jgi:hypothetical protein
VVKRKKTGTCYICGQERALTRDHVFPQGLFPKGTLPSHPKPPIAPACTECQQAVKLHEEYFRTIASAGSSDAAAEALWTGEVARSFKRSPAFERLIASARRTIEWKSAGGLIIGDVAVFAGDQQRMGIVLWKMIRGLFYLDSGDTVMPFDVTYRIEEVTPMSPPMPEVVMKIIHSTPLRELGDIVRYKFGLLAEEPRLSVSWFAFYNPGRMYVVSTRPSGMGLPSVVASAPPVS